MKIEDVIAQKGQLLREQSARFARGAARQAEARTRALGETLEIGRQSIGDLHRSGLEVGSNRPAGGDILVWVALGTLGLLLVKNARIA